MRAYIEAQGGLLLMRLLDQKPRPFLGASKRGRVKSFSQKSRLRLMRFLARIRMKGIRATFITLTYKGYPSNETAKRNLHAFLQHVRRWYPAASCVWRMEYQKRGSIHFHLLCFNLPYWHWEELLETWKGITGQDVSRVDIRLVRSRRGVQSYVSKYIAKVEKRIKKTFLVYPPYLHGMRKWKKGRFWGYHNKKALPLGEMVQGVLTVGKEIKRLSDAAWKIIGDKVRYGSVSFHLFSDHAEKLAHMNISVGGMYLDDWQMSDDLTKREHADLVYIEEHFSERDFENDYAKPPSLWSRPSVASTIQPCTKGWVSRSSFLGRALTELSDFVINATIATNPLCKEQNHAAL